MSARASPKPHRGLFAAFLLFLIAYNLFRVGLYVMTQNGTVKPDHPLDPTVNAVIVYSELAIGLAGLAAVPGLVRSRPWGFWVTLAVSAYAIAFDSVSAVLVQPSAAGGVVPPVVVLAFLLILRSRLIPEASRSEAPSPTRT